MHLEFVLALFQIVVLIFAFSVHESAHAWAAMRLGDATAYMLGRVTLNPVKHIDPLGSIVMPLVALVSGWPLIGWAKPCPVTLRNFKHVRRDDILTTMAGPASNLAIALVSLVLLVILKHSQLVGENAVIAAYNMANGYPEDLTDLPRAFPLALLLRYSILTNVLLFCFNLIPIPPLDGSRVLRYFLPYEAGKVYDRIGGYGIILLFLLGSRLLMPLYLPLLGAFDHVLLSM